MEVNWSSKEINVSSVYANGKVYHLKYYYPLVYSFIVENNPQRKKIKLTPWNFALKTPGYLYGLLQEVIEYSLLQHQNYFPKSRGNIENYCKKYRDLSAAISFKIRMILEKRNLRLDLVYTSDDIRENKDLRRYVDELFPQVGFHCSINSPPGFFDKKRENKLEENIRRVYYNAIYLNYTKLFYFKDICLFGLDYPIPNLSSRSLINETIMKHSNECHLNLTKEKGKIREVIPGKHFKEEYWISDATGILHLVIDNLEIPSEFIPISEDLWRKYKHKSYLIHIAQRLGLWSYGMNFHDSNEIDSFLSLFINKRR